MVALLDELQRLQRVSQRPNGEHVGVPIVVRIIFVLVGPCHSEDNILLPLGRPGNSLRPETGNANQDLKSEVDEVVLVTCIADIIKDCVGNRTIAMNLLKSNFPLVVTFFAVHCHHRVQGSTADKSKFLTILNGLGQVLVPVNEQVAGNFRI